MDPTDPRALRAAAFLVEALDLAEDPIALLPDLVEVSRAPDVAVYAAELDSSVGPAAFLVYAYDLAAVGGDGETGRERFDADLAILQTAAERDAPGPRLVAHALTDQDGFILATTPATLRALSGEARVESLQATPADLLPTGDPLETRRAAAAELLRLLRAVDTEAGTWLAALEAAGHLRTNGADQEATINLSFSPEETELALFLLDERSIRNLLQVLNLLIAAAREHAADAMGDGT